MRLLLVALLILFASGVTGCVHDPTVRFNHAELNGVGFTGFPPRLTVALTTVVDVTNGNSFDIAVRGMRGTAIMADRYPLPIDFHPGAPKPGLFGTGTAATPDQGLWLRAGQTTPMRLPVDLPIELAAALLREGWNAPVVEFHVVGTVDVTGTSSLQVKKDNFPVDLRGVITRQQILGVVPAAFLPH